jgi:uncharacterized protein YxjI
LTKNGEQVTRAGCVCHYHDMPRYVLASKLWSRGDAFIVRETESGRETFRVNGKALGVGDKLSFEDSAGNELAFIRQGLHLGLKGLCYEISRSGQLAARVVLNPRLRQPLLIETPDPGHFEAAGDIPAMNYQISLDGTEVASISTRWAQAEDSYGVAAAAGQDAVFILALAITIETIYQEQGG